MCGTALVVSFVCSEIWDILSNTRISTEGRGGGGGWGVGYIPPLICYLFINWQHIRQRGCCQRIINSRWKGKMPGGVLGSGFAGYVSLVSQNPHPIIVYSVANYRPHLSHFWANVIVISRTELNASRLLNIKTTAGTIFQSRIFLFLNLCLPEFSYPKNPEKLQPHSSNSTKNIISL